MSAADQPGLILPPSIARLAGSSANPEWWRELVLASTGSMQMRNVVSGLWPSGGGATGGTKLLGRLGPAIDPGSVLNTVYPDSYNTGDPVTYAMVMTDYATSYNRLISADGQFFQKRSDQTLQWAAGNFNEFSPVTVPIGEPCIVLASGGNSEPNLIACANLSTGEVQYSYGSSSNPAASTGVSVCNTGGGASFTNGLIYALYAWHRRISLEEFYVLAQDPYAPFRAKRRLVSVPSGTTITLTPNGLVSATTTAAGSISQTVNLAPATLASATQVQSTTIQSTAVLAPAALASGTVVADGALSQSVSIAPEALSSTTQVSNGSVSQTVSLAPEAMTSSTAVNDTAITIGTNPAIILNPDNLGSATSVQETTVIQDVALAPAGLSSGTRTSDANIAQTGKLAPAGMSSMTYVTDTEVFAGAFIEAVSLLSQSTVQNAAIVQQVMLDAEPLISGSRVSDASIYSNIPLIDPNAISVQSITPRYSAISKTSIFTVRSKTP